MVFLFSHSQSHSLIDEEKLCLQVLLVTFAICFIYLVTRSMRFVEEQFDKTSKKITKLRARTSDVLNHQQPICENILHYNLARYRRNIIASYLKDLLDDNQNSSDKFSNLYQCYPQKVQDKQKLSYEANCSQMFDLISKISNQKPLRKDVSANKSSLLINTNKQGMTSSQHCLENKAVKGKQDELMNCQLSKLCKTLEGPKRYSFFDEQKSKIPKRSVDFRNSKERFHKNFTVYTALINAQPTFRIKSQTKQSKLAYQKTKLANLIIKKRNRKLPEMTLSATPAVILGEDNKKHIKYPKTCFEHQDFHEIANNSENYSNLSSTRETDCDSDLSNDLSSQESFCDVLSLQNIPLTTINEESAEENCPSE